MQVLSEGSRYLTTLMSTRKKSGLYYQSSFNIEYEIDNRKLLYNTLSGELVLLSPKEKAFYEHLPLAIDDDYIDLVRHRYVVSDSSSEYQYVEQLRAITLKKLGAKGTINHFNILPTTNCNARCFYCYEAGIKHTNMSRRTADALVSYISEHHNGAIVRLSWFGGEPTLGRLRIDYICEQLSNRGIPFESTMVSNAYLFDDNLVRHARKAWNLNSIQITLDGTESVYNETKSYIHVKDNPYRRVLRNISYFLDEKVYVNVRINMDSHNYENLRELITELTTNFKGNSYLAIYVRQLKEGAGFNPIQHSSDDLDELRKQYLELQDLLERAGWSQIWRFEPPRLKAHSCMADGPHYVQCTPDGILSKCEDEIYEHTVGTLETGIDNDQIVEWWRERDLYEECKTCPLLPSCTKLLKHCPAHALGCDREDREHRISLTREYMAREYRRHVNTGNGLQS